MNIRLTLKNNVRKRRLAVGISQAQLAKDVGVSINTVSSIENEKMCASAYLAAMLCRALDCRFEDLFYFVEEDKSEFDE